MSAERERIEREALEALGVSRRMSMLRTGSPHDPIVQLVLRERAAAFERAAAICLLDGDYHHAAAIDALAAQERAQAGEGGGK